jgi:alkylation response protein AidB-like acyl-CoA dehydrogenase
MDLDFTPEQDQYRDGIRRLLQGEADDALLIDLQDKHTGYVPGLWDALSEGGWHGVVIPEEFGSFGLGLGDSCVVFEEYGAGPLPHLYFTCAGVSPWFVMEAASADQKQRLLPRLADGSLRVTVAIAEVEASWTGAPVATRLTGQGGKLMLNGEKMYVPDALGATHALVSAQSDAGIALVLADLAAPGVSRELLPGFTSWETRVLLENVEVDAEQVLGGLETDAASAIMRAINRAIPGLAAYQVGSSQTVFAMALEHSRTRVQFGQPVGRFQRVQDHIVDLVNHLDSARWLTYETIWRIENGKPGIETALHSLKALAADSHWEACNCSHEVHAGIGADMKYGLAKHTYLSHTLFHFLGSPSWHRERVAETLGW